jgi:hypothetical protein
MLRSRAARLLMLFACTLTLSACCRSPNDKTIAGHWRMPKSPFEVTFYVDHTLFFDNSQLTATGTWHIIGDQLEVVLRDASRPDEDQVFTYSGSKMCHGKLVFGSSRVIGRKQGQQIGEAWIQAGGTEYERVR